MLQPDFFQLIVDVIDEFRKRVDYDDYVDHELDSKVKMIDEYDSEDPVYDDGTLIHLTVKCSYDLQQ